MDVGVGMMQVEVTNRCNLNCPHCFYYEAGEKGEDYNNFLNLKAMHINRKYKKINRNRLPVVWTAEFLSASRE